MTQDKKSIFYFSPQEKIDLLVSYITLSIAFSIVILNFNLIDGIKGSTEIADIITGVLIAFIAVATGFVCHELAHREAAKHFGFHSEFRAWYPMLGIAIIFAFLTGWILAVPGATYFFGNNVSRKQNGLISLAGPISNLILGIILIIAGLLLANPLIATVLITAAVINFWFAFFNLLPIFMLDGTKVLAWRPDIWVVFIIIAGVFTFYTQFLIQLISIIL